MHLDEIEPIHKSWYRNLSTSDSYLKNVENRIAHQKVKLLQLCI
jgi:hypothetical protein